MCWNKKQMRVVSTYKPTRHYNSETQLRQETLNLKNKEIRWKNEMIENLKHNWFDW
jgi:hypothetical protein